MYYIKREINMKKFLAYVLAAACLVSTAFIFSACSSKPAATPAPSAAASAAPALTGDLAAVKKAGVLKVGMECNYAPFNWTQAKASSSTVALTAGGYADGYDVQMAQKMAAALGVKLEIVKIEWEGLTPALQSGKIDAIIAGMSPTAERKVSIDFTAPYYSSELVIVVMANSKFASATSIADFTGAKITGQLGTFHYQVIDQIKGVSKQTAMSDFPVMLNALQSGKIDGYVSELPGAVSASKTNKDIKYIRFAADKGFKATDDDIAVSVGLRKGSNLAETINKALATITKEDREKMMQTAVDNQPASEAKS